MCSFREAALAFLLAVCALQASAQERSPYPGIGRPATPAEVAAWDIDVRPDFKGLPRGSGSVARGQVVWEAKCASCHGVFGESNEVFNPIVGGTTVEDIRTGHVASLRRNDYPGRTTMMKLAHVSTLWDYIRRAMPWNAPKSLSADDVYAVTAYILNLADVVPADFTLDDRNIAQVQQRLPNRNGLTTSHALWPGREFGVGTKPDTQAAACMKDCPVASANLSVIPEHARTQHGELAAQNRIVGPQRGVSVAQQPGGPPQPGSAAVAQAPSGAPTELLQKNSCTACHAADAKIVGPSWSDIAKKHAGQVEYLMGKIRSGGSGTWGAVPMPPQPLPEEDLGRIARWLAQGMSR